jgi:hypothetical protein
MNKRKELIKTRIAISFFIAYIFITACMLALGNVGYGLAMWFALWLMTWGIHR